MTSNQFIGYVLNQTSAITNIVSTRIYHGLRPTGSTVPSINYYEVGGAEYKYGIIAEPFSLNCRASTSQGARSLALQVINLFHGAAFSGIYGVMNNFTVSRCSLRSDGGLIPEPEENIFNCPIDILLVYESNIIS